MGNYQDAVDVIDKANTPGIIPAQVQIPQSETLIYQTDFSRILCGRQTVPGIIIGSLKKGYIIL